MTSQHRLLKQCLLGLCCALLSALASANVTARSTNTDLWSAIRAGFKMHHYERNYRVKRAIQRYQRHPHYFYQMSRRAAPYLYHSYVEAKRRGLPTEFALLPFLESAYNPKAHSSVGADGLWQLMPTTGQNFGLIETEWYDGRRDIVASTNAALNYLSYLGKFFKGNWLLTLAAYDWGEGNIQKAVRYNAHAGRPTNYWSLALPKETHLYVPKLLAIAAIVAHPRKYNMRLPYIKNEKHFKQIKLRKHLSFTKAARLAEMNVNNLAKLNPGHRRWVVDTHTPGKLTLPIEKVDVFKNNLAKVPPSTRMIWHRHQVKKGESLYSIAHNYHTNTTLMRHANDLKTPQLKPGRTLWVPVLTNKKKHPKKHKTKVHRKKISALKAYRVAKKHPASHKPKAAKKLLTQKKQVKTKPVALKQKTAKLQPSKIAVVLKKSFTPAPVVHPLNPLTKKNKKASALAPTQAHVASYSAA